MKTDFNSPGQSTLLSYRTPESEIFELGSQISLCAGSQNGTIESWTHSTDGFNNGDFD